MKIQGTVKRILAVKGYAFVEGDDGREYFFHVGSLLDEADWARVRRGIRISFVSVDVLPGRWRTSEVTVL